MRFNKLYITLFFTIAGAIAGYAQEEQASVSAMRGELNFLYSHILGGKSIGLGGFGSDFHSVLTPVARFAERDEIWARQPLFNLGLEGNLILKPFYQNSALTLSPSLGYSLRYSHERYHIAYSTENASTNGNAVGTIGGPGSKEDIQMNSLINQLAFGVRLDHNQSKLYANFSLGMLLYTPLSLKWHRQAYDAKGNPTTSITHSIGLGQSKLINDVAASGSHTLSLRGTSEFLASLGARVGYGPIFMGVNYATNIRVNVVSFDLGITLHPFARSNS